MCVDFGGMYSAIQDRERLEDDLYQEDEGDSEVSEVNSELEFHLYSQLHYSSNAAEIKELEDEEEKDKKGLENHQLIETTRDGDRELEYTNDSKTSSAVDHSFQQHQKKKKIEKQKTKKTDRKDQKFSSSSSVFEEFIVIDSSPDVITISESDASDDEGVCVIKGRGLLQMKTSTPAQQEIQRRKRSPSVPETVVSSSSEASESDSDSSGSEDSDDLENWMILGQGMQDGDQSISLNLEGGSDSSSDAKDEEGSWLVSKRDKEALIYNKDRGPRLAVQRVVNRYYTGKNVHCRNCNKTGHLSKNCPDPKKLLPCFLCGMTSHQARECPNKYCNNCGQPGHLYNSCSERAYWHKQCHRCRMKGHFLDACPEIWRQYHITIKSGPPVKQQRGNNGQSAYCYNCSKKGHFGFACTKQRMFSGVFPSSSLIGHYDSNEEIKRRQHRVKLKVNDIRKGDCLPVPSPTFHSPGPPKKKQKISHHTKNHTPHQTLNQHTASPNHIFFSDSDFRTFTPKTKGFKQQQSVGSVKPWKPKRLVPTSRDPLPSSKLILDEADDFPRGGGSPQNKEKKKKKKKRNKPNRVSLFQSVGHNDGRSDRVCRPESGNTQGPASKNQNGKKKKNLKNQKTANGKSGAQLHPADDLFTIKQRKRRKQH